MPGVVDHGDVGVPGAVGEVAQHAAGIGCREIVARIDDVEAGTLEHVRDHRAIIDRVGERRHVLIGGIAKHQRHPLLGAGRLARQQHGRGKTEQAQP